MGSYYYNVRLKNRAWTEVYISEIERPVGQYVLLQAEFIMENHPALNRPFPPDVGIIVSKLSEDDAKVAMEKARRTNNNFIPEIICSITKDEFDSNSIPLGTKEIKERRKAEIAAASKKAGPR